MSTVSAGFEGHSDAELIVSVRAGTLAAYGTLYERHVAAAYNLARRLGQSAVESDDLVSEAFAKVLDILRAGKGPDSAFRAYLLTTLRHTAYAKNRKDRWLYLNEDMSAVSRASGAAAEALTVQFSDTVVAGLDRTLAAKAFTRLSERWRAVLWHTEIEQQPPAEVALILGLTPNGVSALAHRAREALRQAYLQVHLAETPTERCRATAERLGAWTRQGLAKRERAQVEAHLDECARCRELAAELADVNGALRAVVAPIVLGDAAFDYLTATGRKANSSGPGTAAGREAGSRQVVAVAIAGAAIAAAVAAALAMTGGAQTIPTAVGPQPGQPAPAPELRRPAVPPGFPLPLPPVAGQVPPVEVLPAPQLWQSPAPPQPFPPPAQQPPSPPPGTEIPASLPDRPSTAPDGLPPSTVPPAEHSTGTMTAGSARPPRLIVQGPPAGVELRAGDVAVELSITVHNDGGVTSEPMIAALNLPYGVHTVSPAAPLVAAHRDTSLVVDCSGSQGASASRTKGGLGPGQTTVITLWLAADPDARNGAVTGTINAGAGTRAPVSISVSIKTARNGSPRREHVHTARDAPPSVGRPVLRFGLDSAPGDTPIE